MTMVEAQKGELDLANIQEIKELKMALIYPALREYKAWEQVCVLNIGPRSNETGITMIDLKGIVTYPDDKGQLWGEYKVLKLKGEDFKS